MINQEVDSPNESELDQLARKTGAPLAVVQEIYQVERDKIEKSARIKTDSATIFSHIC